MRYRRMINGSKKQIDINGNISYLNARELYHRIDGPAYEGYSGTKSWWINGVRHRDDGPAKMWEDGSKEYYIYMVLGCRKMNLWCGNF